jgi:hypothetical protein
LELLHRVGVIVQALRREGLAAFSEAPTVSKSIIRDRDRDRDDASGGSEHSKLISESVPQPENLMFMCRDFVQLVNKTLFVYANL